MFRVVLEYPYCVPPTDLSMPFAALSLVFSLSKRSCFLQIIWITPFFTIERTQESNCRVFCIFVVRSFQAGTGCRPKFWKLRNICLVVPLVVGSVPCCPGKKWLSRLLEKFTLDNWINKPNKQDRYLNKFKTFLLKLLKVHAKPNQFSHSILKYHKISQFTS